MYGRSDRSRSYKSTNNLCRHRKAYPCMSSKGIIERVVRIVQYPPSIPALKQIPGTQIPDIAASMQSHIPLHCSASSVEKIAKNRYRINNILLDRDRLCNIGPPPRHNIFPGHIIFINTAISQVININIPSLATIFSRPLHLRDCTVIAPIGNSRVS